MQPDFEVNKTYNRQRDIHDRYGGSRQSGISPSAEVPAVFLFTGGIGQQFGYKDEWDERHEVFHYVGEGQLGDMEFIRGNKAIREHLADGKQLFLFEGDGQGNATFVGEFICAGHHLKQGPDRDGKQRRLIVFELKSVEHGSPAASVSDAIQAEADEKSLLGLSLQELRSRVLASPDALTASTVQLAAKEVAKRSRIAVAYVRKRAAGHCEGCGDPAPFRTNSGEPYLEAHHIRRKADEGLDHPEWMVAICPTCHRRVHHGQDGKDYNESLRLAAFAREADPDPENRSRGK